METGEKKPKPRGKKPAFRIVKYAELSPEQQRRLLELKAEFIRRASSASGNRHSEKAIAGLARDSLTAGYEHFVALEEGNLLGYIALFREPERLEVAEFFSAKEGKGVGTALVAKAIAVARGGRLQLRFSQQTRSGHDHLAGIKRRYEASRASRGIPPEKQKLAFSQSEFIFLKSAVSFKRRNAGQKTIHPK